MPPLSGVRMPPRRPSDYWIAYLVALGGILGLVILVSLFR